VTILPCYAFERGDIQAEENMESLQRPNETLKE